MKSKRRLSALLTALVMVMSMVMDGQVIPAIAEETAVTEEISGVAPVGEQLSGETVPVPEATASEQAVEPEPEVSEPVTEPKTEATEAVTEPKTEAIEAVTEPKAEATEAVTEPKTEATEAVTEPKIEAAEPVTEPKTEASESVTESKPEGTEAATEPATEGIGTGQGTEGTGTEQAPESRGTEQKTENGGTEQITEGTGTEQGTESVGTERVTEGTDTGRGTESETEGAHTEEAPETESETGDEKNKPMEQTLTVSGGGDAVITLAGFMPEKVRAEAKPVQVEIEGQTVLAAYDITIYDRDGQVYQPGEGAIQVSITDAAVREALEQADDLSVYHMKDAGAAPEEVREVTTTNAEVVFEAESFSIYVVTTPETHYTHTYIFYDDDGKELSRQILSPGETLRTPKSPAASDMDHKVFRGWYTELTGGTRFTDFGKTEGSLTASSTTNLYAQYDTAYYVFYKAGNTENSKVLFTQKYENGAAVQTGDVPFNTGNVNMALIGWSTDPEAETPAAGLTISGNDVTLYPVVKEAHWITYDSQGGSSVEPAYVLASGVTREPTEVPTRKGYTFGGWYADADYGNRFTFGNPLSENITLYAKWTPAQTSYTVIFWKQQVTDNKNALDNEKKYDYGESEVRYADTGATVSAMTADKQKDYFGFQYNDNKQFSATVAADGSTVLNVYYDRKLMTMKFYEKNWYGQTTLLYTFTGLYEAKFDANDRWDTSYNWQYKAGSVTRVQTYMEAFIFPPEMGTSTTMEFTKVESGSYEFIHYTENLDGTWKEEATAKFNGNTSFKLSNKFIGFTVCQWRMYKNRAWGEWHDCMPDDNTDSGYSKLEIRHKRNSYTLDYVNGTGGIVKSESVKYEQPLAAYADYVPAGRPSDMPDFYSFRGWYKDPEGTEAFDFSQTMPTNNLVVYAKWAPDQVTVSFETSGGTQIAPQTFHAGLTAAKPEDPEREGYTFAGWTRNGQPFNFDTEILENTILTAQWISNDQYTISYHPNGAVSEEGTVITQLVEDTAKYANGAKAKVQVVPESWKAPDERDGFICWNTAQDGSGTDYYPGDTYTMPDGNVVLYAKWAPCRKTTLTYHYNGGKDSAGNAISGPEVIDIPNGEYTILKDGSDISRQGYVFIGWSTKENEENTSALLKAGDKIQVDTLNPETNVLYAQWKKLLTVTVKKVVTGNMGDKNTSFCFSYSVTPPEDGTQSGGVLSGTNTFTLKANGEIQLSDIMPGSRITVTETTGAEDGYVTQVQKTGDANPTTANGCEISNLQAETTVITFTNTREVVPPTGLTDNGAPFTAMVVLSLMGMAGLFLLRRGDRRLL